MSAHDPALVQERAAVALGYLAGNPPGNQVEVAFPPWWHCCQLKPRNLLRRGQQKLLDILLATILATCRECIGLRHSSLGSVVVSSYPATCAGVGCSCSWISCWQPSWQPGRGGIGQRHSPLGGVVVSSHSATCAGAGSSHSWMYCWQPSCNQVEVALAGNSSSLVALLSAYTPPLVQKRAAITFGYPAGNHLSNQVEKASASAIPPLVALLSAQIPPLVHERAAVALGYLAGNHPGN